MSRLLRFVYALFLLLCIAPAAQAIESNAAKPPLRIGLTPVFLDDQAAFLNKWRDYLQRHLERPVTFVQRGSYREIVDMLHDRKLDFAWLCGYPYVRNHDHLRLVAVPLYLGEPLYQSYLIVPSTDQQTRSLSDLRGKVFAFSDPDSNSGHLYPEYLLAKQGFQPATFFAKSFFTWSHRKVVEAVATGLAQGGAVDGYVWDVLSQSHPELTSRTRIVNESEQFGYPPIVASRSVSKQDVSAFRDVLLHMMQEGEGTALLGQLGLDGFVEGNRQLYEGIAVMSRFVEKQRNAVPQGH